MIGGFGEAGSPIELIHALIDHGPRNLTVISNNTGSGRVGLAALIANRQVRKMICSYPRSANSMVFPELYRSGRNRTGTRAAGNSGRTHPGRRRGHPCILHTLRPSARCWLTARNRASSRGGIMSWSTAFARTSLWSRPARADRYGNLVYNKTARNFAPVMCMAAKTTIVQVQELVEAGEIDPETVVTPGIFVQRLVVVADPAQESQLVKEGKCYP